MKSLLVVLFVALALLLVAPAQAGPPINGTYQSTDLGGPLLLGRYTESWTMPNGFLMMGNTSNGASWNGATLATQWRYFCPMVSMPPDTLINNVNALGNGNRTFMKTYVGGYVWLSGAGPWANGDAQYTGLVTSYTEFETVQYVSFARVAAVANVQATATFDGYSEQCMNFAVGNMAQRGKTDTMTKPATYPGFLDPSSCNPTRTMGSWWDMFTLTLTITGCTVDTEATTWGAVKSLYQ